VLRQRAIVCDNVPCDMSEVQISQCGYCREALRSIPVCTSPAAHSQHTLWPHGPTIVYGSESLLASAAGSNIESLIVDALALQAVAGNSTTQQMGHDSTASPIADSLYSALVQIIRLEEVVMALDILAATSIVSYASAKCNSISKQQ
jgi:hypothetical protein